MHFRRLSARSFWEWARNVPLARVWTTTAYSRDEADVRAIILNNYIEQAQLDASGFRSGHNLVGVKTPRSIRVGDFPLLHDYSVAFNQRLQNYKVSKLRTNPAVACWPRSTHCLGIARGWQTTLADCQRNLREKSKLDAILKWRLTFIDCWVEPRLFGTMLRFEQLGALGSDIARTTEI